MTLAKAIALGLAQGLAEFLPISSSGHLVILQHYLHTPEAGLAFDVLLHLATGLAVIVYFWRDILRVLTKPKLLALLIVASIPAGIVGVVLEDLIAQAFSSVLAVGIALLLTGAILWIAEDIAKRGRNKKPFDRISFGDALIVGLGQAVAIVPGISRSGSTIAAALALDIEREAAARFSFLMSIPVILGAGLLQARHLIGGSLGMSGSALAGGFIASFVAGILSIGILLSVLKRYGLKVFAVYVWVVGAAVVLAQIP